MDHLQVFFSLFKKNAEQRNYENHYASLSKLKPKESKYVVIMVH